MEFGALPEMVSVTCTAMLIGACDVAEDAAELANDVDVLVGKVHFQAYPFLCSVSHASEWMAGDWLQSPVGSSVCNFGVPEMAF